MNDRATVTLLNAIDGWRASHKADPLFSAIDQKLTSLVDDLQGDKDGDLKAKSSPGKPSFPTANTVAAHFGGMKSARGGNSA